MHGFFHVSQTNFLALTLTKLSLFTIFKEKRVISTFAVLILLTLLLSSCTTKPSIKRAERPKNTVTQKVPEVVTAEEKLALAQTLHKKLLKSALINESNLNSEHDFLAQQASINHLLVDACELYLQEQNYTKALWLANEIQQTYQSDKPQVDITNQQRNYQNDYRLLLVKARSLLALNYYQQAQQQLQIANELVSYTNNNTIPSLTLTFEYYQSLNQVLSAQNQLIPALVAQLNAFALNPAASNEDIQTIWRNLEPLTQWQIAQLIHNKPPFIKGWTELLNYSHKFGSNPQQFSRYLHLWQQHYPAHPAVAIISQLQTPQSAEQLTVNTLENIAILLPLTGSQQKAGLAVQQGILAAFDNDSNRNLFFIDTNQLDWQSLGDNFTQLKIDHIIGPLLKANVETFLNASAQQIPLQIPTLLLNLPYQHSLTDTQFALSMRPEDEAIQAAATLSQHNYHNPIVISHNDRVSKRIAIAFREQWQLSTNNTIDIVYFDQGKQMQANLKESLDVNTSQTRIKQLNARLKHNIESEPRNRRDIDMIYLVGSSAQTRLIKPYIDVNISPFAEVIPVFASSRSHSDFNDKNTASSISDLQGLTFTQIPWLLNSKQQNKKLNKLSESLWPMRTDSLSRIFAMGYDSYHLLSKLTLMRQTPYIRHFGQTGVLKLSNNNILTRSLIWGQYKNDKVIEVAMD
tara:strand:+ start:1499 stop:3565 length:2067 start_codon:yes stop_codon:yes gene_type:complete